MSKYYLILIILISASVLADSPAMPWPKVVASSIGRHYFKMMPEVFHFEGERRIIDSDAYGVAYELDQGGVEK